MATVHGVIIPNPREAAKGLYQKYFGMSVNFTDVTIPEDRGYVFIMPKGLTFAAVVGAMRQDSIQVDIDDDVIKKLDGEINIGHDYTFRMTACSNILERLVSGFAHNTVYYSKRIEGEQCVVSLCDNNSKVCWVFTRRELY